MENSDLNQHKCDMNFFIEKQLKDVVSFPMMMFIYNNKKSIKLNFVPWKSYFRQMMLEGTIMMFVSWMTESP